MDDQRQLAEALHRLLVVPLVLGPLEVVVGRLGGLDAREDVDKARQALEVVTARVTRELQRFKALRAAELRRAIASYVALQAEHSAALRDQWAELLPDLDAGALPPPPAEEAVGV